MKQGMATSIVKQLAKVEQLRGEGRGQEALTLARHVWDLAQEHLGEGQPEYAFALKKLAKVSCEMGDELAAESLSGQLANILGEQHPDHVHFLKDLAGLHWKRGDLTTAHRLFLRAAEIYRVALGEDNSFFVESLTNLAKLSWARGDRPGAESFCERAV